MDNAASSKQEFEIGTYICPATKAEVHLAHSTSVAFIRWPLVVDKCAACGSPHELQSVEVLHPPVYGRE